MDVLQMTPEEQQAVQRLREAVLGLPPGFRLRVEECWDAQGCAMRLSTYKPSGPIRWKRVDSFVSAALD
jgi:hypothetical protein